MRFAVSRTEEQVTFCIVGNAAVADRGVHVGGWGGGVAVRVDEVTRAVVADMAELVAAGGIGRRAELRREGLVFEPVYIERHAGHRGAVVLVGDDDDTQVGVGAQEAAFSAVRGGAVGAERAAYRVRSDARSRSRSWPSPRCRRTPPRSCRRSCSRPAPTPGNCRAAPRCSRPSAPTGRCRCRRPRCRSSRSRPRRPRDPTTTRRCARRGSGRPEPRPAAPA